MSTTILSVVPLAVQDRLSLFFEVMQQHEQDIREAALAVEYCNVFGQPPVSPEQCTAAIQALGALRSTMIPLQESFIGLWVPIRIIEMREAVQSPWRLVLEITDEAIVLLASLRAVLPVVEARDLHLRLDVFEIQNEVREAVADAFRTNACWRTSVRVEEERFTRLREAAQLRRQAFRRRRRWM